MINVFAVFTGKLLQTLQNSSFYKTCYLDAKTNVLHNFALALQTLQNSSFHKTCHLDAKTNVLHNFALAL